MLWRSLFGGMIVAVVTFCTFVYYYYRSKKELGGITGDTAGYFVLLCECSVMIATAVVNIVWM
jgi:adenosylcobinamide-GDP ribazoletransferase